MTTIVTPSVWEAIGQSGMLQVSTKQMISTHSQDSTDKSLSQHDAAGARSPC